MTEELSKCAEVEIEVKEEFIQYVDKLQEDFDFVSNYIIKKVDSNHYRFSINIVEI